MAGGPADGTGDRADARAGRIAIVRNDVRVMSRAPPTPTPSSTTIAPAGASSALQRFADDGADEAAGVVELVELSRTLGPADDVQIPSAATATSDHPMTRRRGLDDRPF